MKLALYEPLTWIFNTWKERPSERVFPAAGVWFTVRLLFDVWLFFGREWKTGVFVSEALGNVSFCSLKMFFGRTHTEHISSAPPFLHVDVGLADVIGSRKPHCIATSELFTLIPASHMAGVVNPPFSYHGSGLCSICSASYEDRRCLKLM